MYKHNAHRAVCKGAGQKGPESIFFVPGLPNWLIQPWLEDIMLRGVFYNWGHQTSANMKGDYGYNK